MEERITIRITKEMLEKLNAQALQNKTSASRLIREALVQYLQVG